jgi:hypothetical protein
VFEPYTRMAFLKVKTSDWSHALQKPGILKRNEKINFSLEYAITDMKLDQAHYQAAKPKWERVFELIGGGHDKLQDLVNEGGIEAFGRRTSLLI